MKSLFTGNLFLRKGVSIDPTATHFKCIRLGSVISSHLPFNPLPPTDAVWEQRKITQFDKKKVIFCPHVLMVIFPFLGGKNDGK